MSKNYTKLVVGCASALLLLAGCSMFEDGKKDVKDAAEKVEKSDPVKDTEKTIDNMMDWLKEKGVEVNDMEVIDQMDFAAHEGRSFTYNGHSAYMYRINTSDEKMKQFMKDAEKNKKVKVKENGEEKEYSAAVNGDYLFIYNSDDDMGDFLKNFPNYNQGMTNTSKDK